MLHSGVVPESITTSDSAFTYPPINTLKPVAADIWIVDGPAVRFGVGWFKFPFPARMTIVRLAGGNLFIHSPTPLTAELRGEVVKLGMPRWIIGPNRLHHTWIAEWKAAFPAAEVHVSPRLAEQAGRLFDFDVRPIDRTSGLPWDAEIATLLVPGDYLTEVEFFHPPSRTLILTDLIENFEPSKLRSFMMRWMTRLGGVQDPDGQTPRDLRLTYATRKVQVRDAVERMIEWNPERVILAHGRWYDRDGTAELRRALRWALK